MRAITTCLVAAAALSVSGALPAQAQQPGAEAGAWQTRAEMPEARWEMASAMVGGTLYLFGGYGAGVKSSRHVDAFDVEENTWRRLAELPSAITHMNAVVDGRSVWLAGGFKDGYPGHAIDEVWRYDIDDDRFFAAEPLPEPRAGGGLALVGRRLHYIGGLMSDRDTDSSDHWVIDLDGSGTWTNAAPMPAPRNQFGTINLNGQIYVMGGQLGHDSRNGQPGLDQTRVDIYDPSTDSWRAGPDLPKPHSHAEGSTLLSEGRIFVIGGRAETRNEAAIWVLSHEGEWSLFADLPQALTAPAAGILDGLLVVAGGAPSGSTPHALVWARTVEPGRD